MKINIKGAIIQSDEAWIYDWYGMEYTTAKNIERSIRNAQPNESIVFEINSGGGDVFAGSEIRTLIASVADRAIINIVGLAGSAASVAATGAKCFIAPTAMMMIHNVACSTSGDYNTMDHTSEILKKANEAVANAYVAKTGRDRQEFLDLMQKETWFTAEEAKEAGLVDGIMFENQNISLINGIGAGKLLPREVIDKMQAEKAQKLQDFDNKFKKLGGTAHV